MATTTKPKKRVRKPIVPDALKALGVSLRRFDPDEDFSDVDGDPNGEFALENEAPDRHYHWAHNSVDDVGKYTGGILGYSVEHFEEGGVFARQRSGQVMGEPITKRDHVLVSCPLDRWQKRNRYERAETLKTNRAMFKTRQRDLDARDLEDFRDQMDDDYVRPTTRGGPTAKELG